MKARSEMISFWDGRGPSEDRHARRESNFIITGNKDQLKLGLDETHCLQIQGFIRHPGKQRKAC